MALSLFSSDPASEIVSMPKSSKLPVICDMAQPLF